MAVYPTTSQSGNAPATPSQSIDVEAWAAQASHAMGFLSIASPGGVSGTSVSLAIDLDHEEQPRPSTLAQPSAQAPRRKLMRRDSLDRREALLKGKEGSRRRVRWENDRLLNNPWAQPPLPSDWEVHPTYPRRSVPYYLAPLWDQGRAARAEAQISAARRARQSRGDKAVATGHGEVPKVLKQRLKRAKAAKGLLRELEEEVRSFVQHSIDEAQRRRQTKSRSSTLSSDMDSSDEEIVFVGRSDKLRDSLPSCKFEEDSDSFSDLGSESKPSQRQSSSLEQHRLILDNLESDRGAGFGRWLIYNIAEYYGLRTWSRTIGDPARREAYVGMPLHLEAETLKSIQTDSERALLPMPLWRFL